MYIGDIRVLRKDFAEHLSNLKEVFIRLRNMILAEGISADSEKIKTVKIGQNQRISR